MKKQSVLCWLIPVFLCAHLAAQTPADLLSLNPKAWQLPKKLPAGFGNGLTFNPVPSSSLDSLIQACQSHVNSDSLRSYVQSLEDFGTRFMLAQNHREVAVWIRDKFIQLGYPNTVLDSMESVIYWGGDSVATWQYNIVATLTGTVHPDQVFIVGGHYDAIIYSGGDPYEYAPGADDNASAIAAAFEVARAFKQAGYQPDATIKFIAFAGEERGFIGSFDYVIKALTSLENIKFMLNLDMISNETADSNWKVKIFTYDGCDWASNIATQVCENYTSFTPRYSPTNSSGSDSFLFWLGGFQTVYFEEDEFSPNWHFPSDTVGNCNFPYLAEVTRLSCGTMLYAAEIPLPVSLKIYNTGDGHSLMTHWNPCESGHIAGYKVSIGTSSGVYDTTCVTTDTSMLFSNLTENMTYYFGVSAFNDNGTEGPVTEKSDAPVIITMNQGILIVDDSKGAILDPPDSTVDAYYERLFHNYPHGYYDAAAEDTISLGDLGPYSAVVWHVNNLNGNSVLSKYQDELGKYLERGGNVLLTLYRPTLCFDNTAGSVVSFAQNSFALEYARIAAAENKPVTACIRAIPADSGYMGIEIDTTKTAPLWMHHLPNVEALYLAEGGEVLYTYGTDYDSTNAHGFFKNRPIGIGHFTDQYKVITLSLPLYYMDSTDAKEFVDFVMKDKFNIFPLDAREPSQVEDNVTLSNFPNPFSNRTMVHFRLENATQVVIKIIDPMGKSVRVLTDGYKQAGDYSVPVDASGLQPGIYYCRIETPQKVFTRKMILIR